MLVFTVHTAVPQLIGPRWGWYVTTSPASLPDAPSSPSPSSAMADAEFCATLDSALDKLFARARPIAPGHDLLAEPGWSDPKGRAYSDARAQWEELWQ